MFLNIALASSVLFTQHFTCFPDDVYSTDRIVVSLKAEKSEIPETGTLYLFGGFDHEGDLGNSGVLPMEFQPELSRRDHVVYSGENKTASYSVTLPSAGIGKASKEIRLHFELEHKDSSYPMTFEMSCYSSVRGGGSEGPRGFDLK
jgi:hypothetical protein